MANRGFCLDLLLDTGGLACLATIDDDVLFIRFELAGDLALLVLVSFVLIASLELEDT
jgi:hypothetical protein